MRLACLARVDLTCVTAWQLLLSLFVVVVVLFRVGVSLCPGNPAVLVFCCFGFCVVCSSEASLFVSESIERAVCVMNIAAAAAAAVLLSSCDSALSGPMSASAVAARF